MRKGISFTGAILAILLLSACNKDKKSYKCTCQGGFSGQGKEVNVSAKSDNDAEILCAKHNDDPNTADGYHDCHIK